MKIIVCIKQVPDTKGGVEFNPDGTLNRAAMLTIMNPDDKAVLVTDRRLGGADTWATSTTIAGAIRNLEYDLIITGRQAIDGDTAQVGPQIAEKLGLPQITYAGEITKEGNTLTVKRILEDGYMMISVDTPCMITCIKELNTPRYMNDRDIRLQQAQGSPADRCYHHRT